MANSFKMSTLTLNVVFTMWYFISVHSEKILAIEPKGGRSQWNFMKGILHALTDHGHNVTVFTPFPEGHRENYTEIDLSKEIIPLVGLDIDFVQTKLPQCTDLIRSNHNFSQNTCKIIYENSVIQDIMNDSKPNFDIIIVELQASECISYLSVVLNIPLIYVAPPPIVSYVNVPRTFFERLINAILLFYTSLIRHYKFWSLSIADTKSINVVESIEPSIVFSNAHDISDVSRPLLPNVIQIGGIHLRPPQKIPNDILEFIDNSQNGVIFFTLGSVVAISSLPEKTKKRIIEVLGQIPQRVLLKYEEEMTSDLPKNVMTRKWFPQRDILMHPNVKLFISHGGISGVYEAVDAGVPVLGFPLLFDQKKNLENLVDAGMAITMSLHFLSKDIFKKSILEIINNEKYTKNAKIVSDRFKDRPMSPAQTVDYWTRYVIRHKGAPHLKSHALNLTWYQYFLLDEIIIVTSIILIIFLVMYILFIRIKQCIFQSSFLLKLKYE